MIVTDPPLISIFLGIKDPLIREASGKSTFKYETESIGCPFLSSTNISSTSMLKLLVGAIHFTLILPILEFRPLKVFDNVFSATDLKIDTSNDWRDKIMLKKNKHKTIVPNINATNSPMTLNVFVKVSLFFLLEDRSNNL